MALRRFLMTSNRRGDNLPFAVASIGKIVRLAPYSTESSGKNNNKPPVTTKLKRKQQETAKSLLKDVSWSLHPGAKQRRWETREEINKYIKEIKDTTAMRKKDQPLSSTQEQTSTNHVGKLHASELHSRFGRKQQNGTIRSHVVDMDKVKKYTEILENSTERLGIFDPFDGTKEKADKDPEYKTAVDWWDHFEKERIKRFDTIQPKNHYQEMLGWSEENKLPSLPIDNEVGMEEEQNVPFYKHVFLHELLEDGFPKQGPIRKFMEAVIVGLSKNPYLTVQEKEEHVQWFREYFNEKMETLRNLGVAGEDIRIEQKT